MSDEEEFDHAAPVLVMPFVVCESQGGPYDDDAFVAGCRYASIDHALQMILQFGVTQYEQWIEPALVPQLDLLAMHLGWKLTAEPWEDHPDEWVLARFVKAEEAP